MKTRVMNIKNDTPDVYIGRPSKFGNPFQIGPDGTRAQVIEKYRDWIMKNPKLIKEAKRTLKGKKLGCFCKPLACHGDVLVEIVEKS